MTPRPALVIALVAALADTSGAQPAAPPAAQPAAEMWTTDALVARATAGHPSIAAASADARRTEADARQVGAWPNPRVDYLAENLQRAGGDPRAQHTVLFEQPILLGGKLKLSRGALTHASASATANAAAIAMSVANAVRLRAVEVRLAEARLALDRRLVAYAEDAEDIARQLFNTGVVDQPDVLAAEAEAEIMRLRLAVGETVREQTWQQLALAVGDPALPRRRLMDEAPVALDRTEALAAILSAHPTLAAARAEAARAEAAHGLARADRVPDLTIAAGPRYSSERAGPGGSAVGWEPVFGAGLRLPLWNRNQGGIASATAAGQAAAARLEATELAIRVRFEDVWQRHAAAVRTADAYARVIVPKATAAYEMSLARYRAMALAYPLVLAAQRALLAASDAHVDAVAEQARAEVLLRGFLLGAEGDM